jgi:enoyl-CoA hydratase
VVRLVLDRPRQRNAQNLEMLYALDEAFTAAIKDESSRVIILAGEGPDFSTGHDLFNPLFAYSAAEFSGGGGAAYPDKGFARYYRREQEVYLDLCRKWRNLPLPTIAQVHGHCLAGGLMLAWVCDLIVAADDAVFRDPVVAMGVCGVEYFAHPWEMGPRKAKEMLFTSSSWSAQDAREWGMVNRVVPAADLAAETLAMATVIAAQPPFAVELTKRAVNAATDAQGQALALDKAFALHQLTHAYNLEQFGQFGDPTGAPDIVKKKLEGE